MTNPIIIMGIKNKQNNRIDQYYYSVLSPFISYYVDMFIICQDKTICKKEKTYLEGQKKGSLEG